MNRFYSAGMVQEFPRLTRVLHVALLLSSMATAAHAQRHIPLAVGDRVRITAPQLPARLYGRVADIDPAREILVLTTPDAQSRVTVPVAGVHRVDVSRGHQRLAGAAVGFGVGFLLGAPLGARANRGMDFGLGFIAGGLTGVVFGAPIGFAFAPERWERRLVADAGDAPVTVTLKPGARVRRFSDGTVAVKGERDRKRGIVRGAVVLAGLVAVVAGVDARKGEITGDEYAGAVFSNALLGGAIGYFIAPRKWQRLPAPP